MGWEVRELRIGAHVSRHNSDADRRDDSLWEELTTRIELIVREYRYQDIDAHVI